MDLLNLFLNNGYNPFTGQSINNRGLGYKPPRNNIRHFHGEGIIEKDKDGNYITNTTWEGEAGNWEVGEDADAKFLWQLYYSADADEEDKRIIREYLNKSYDINKDFINESNNFVKTLTEEQQKKEGLEVLDFYGNKAQEAVDKTIASVKGMEKLEYYIDKKQQDEEDEGETEIVDGGDEEETEPEITIGMINKNIQRLSKIIDNGLKLNQVLEIENPEQATLKSRELEKVYKEMQDYETLKKLLNEKTDEYYKPIRKYEFEDEDTLEEAKNTIFNIDEYSDLGIKNINSLKYINDYEDIIEPADLTKDIQEYSPAFMKQTIFNAHNETLSAGKVLEKNISGEENKKIAEAITGQEGSVLLWGDKVLTQPVMIEEHGKEVKKTLSSHTADSFCYDCWDNINFNIVECKKYDSIVNFKELVQKFTDQYNNFFYTYKLEIEEKKIEIDKLNDLIKITSKYNKKNVSTPEGAYESIEHYKGLSIDELKETLNKKKNTLDTEIAYSQNNKGEFDENKFKLLFYKRSQYEGITMKITKFPNKNVEYIDFNKLGKDVNSSPNSKDYYTKLAKAPHHSSYNISASTAKGKIGQISNIRSANITKGGDVDKILDKKFDFIDKKRYNLIYAVATDDALLKFNYSDFIKNRIGSNQFVGNFFRGTYSFYGKEGKLDSILIPLDCFVPINLSAVYDITAKPKQNRKKK